MEVSTTTGDYPIKDQKRIPNRKKRTFCYLTLNEILTILCAASIPVALGIYTGITTEQQRRQAEQSRQFDLKQAAELRQQTLYDKFLSDIYNLDKDGHLSDDQTPWAFANAYYRVAHRQWDSIRRADVLLFLKEKQLIGKTKVIEQRLIKQFDNRIYLNGLNFDNIYLKSQTDSINLLDLTLVSFNQTSMNNVQFLFINLDETSFNYARLNYVQFHDSTLVNANFERTELYKTNFGNSNLTNTRFLNVNLSTAILTEEQIKQAIFYNTTLPNGTLVNSIINQESTTTTRTTTTTTTEERLSTTQQRMTTYPQELLSADISVETQTTIITNNISDFHSSTIGFANDSATSSVISDVNTTDQTTATTEQSEELFLNSTTF